jgi:hypothetical protein
MNHVCRLVDCLVARRRLVAQPGHFWPLLVAMLLTLFGPAARLRAESETHDHALESTVSSSIPWGWSLLGGNVVTADDECALTPGTTLLRSEYAYRNFVLEFDYEVRGNGPGPKVFLHSDWDRDRNTLSGQAIQLSRPVVQRAVRHRRFGRVRYRACPVAGWRHLRLEVSDGDVMVQVDGELVQQVTLGSDRQGYVALHVASGYGASVAIRDLRILELDYRVLFNGQDLADWEGATADAATCWDVQDGLLVCTGEKGTWLRSKEQFGDFNLRLEYRLQEAGNSGVYVRVPADGNHHGQGAGIEVQMLDDAAARYVGLKPYQFSGSLYAVAPAMPHVARPAGQWNSLEINCQGMHYQIRQNGVIVVDATPESFPEIAVRLTKGYLGIQNHNEPLAIRNIRLGEPVPK